VVPRFPGELTVMLGVDEFVKLESRFRAMLLGSAILKL